LYIVAEHFIDIRIITAVISLYRRVSIVASEVDNTLLSTTCYSEDCGRKTAFVIIFVKQIDKNLNDREIIRRIVGIENINCGKIKIPNVF